MNALLKSLPATTAALTLATSLLVEKRERASCEEKGVLRRLGDLDDRVRFFIGAMIWNSFLKKHSCDDLEYSAIVLILVVRYSVWNGWFWNVVVGMIVGRRHCLEWFPWFFLFWVRSPVELYSKMYLFSIASKKSPLLCFEGKDILLYFTNGYWYRCCWNSENDFICLVVEYGWIYSKWKSLWFLNDEKEATYTHTLPLIQMFRRERDMEETVTAFLYGDLNDVG